MRRTRRWAAAAAAVVWLLLGSVPAWAVASAQQHTAELTRAQENGWFSDGTGKTFRASDALTRGRFFSALAALDGVSLPAVGRVFADVPSGHPDARAIAWAVTSGLAAGTGGGNFSPERRLTREQLAEVLVAYANYRGTVLPRRRAVVPFSDMEHCSDRGLDALVTLYRAGVLDTAGQAIRPRETVTCGDGAVILCRYQDLCARKCPQKEQGMLISHKGDCVNAPENTLPAFALSDEKGFVYVEADIRFTRDGVPVLLHDATIDRTSNGSGRVAEMTWEQLRPYDFSAGKAEYAATQIPAFSAFLELCAKRYLHPFIELKGRMSGQQMTKLLAAVSRCGMTQHVTWISVDDSNLRRIRLLQPAAELGVLCSYPDEERIRRAERLKNRKNRVYLCAKYNNVTDSVRAQCLRAGVSLEVWTVRDRNTAVRQLNTSAVGITVDGLTAQDIYRG